MKKVVLFTLLAVGSFFNLQAAQVDGWQPDKNVVFMGASIADFGWYIPYVQVGFASRMPELKLSAINAGVGGDSMQRAMLRLDFDVLRFNPQRVCISIGDNSLGYSLYDKEEMTPKKLQYIDSTVAMMDSALDVIKEKGVEPILFSLAAYDSYGTGPGKNLKYYNETGKKIITEKYRELAEKKGVKFVDFYTPMTEIVKANPTMGLCGPDRLHPRRTGHLIVALEILKAFGAFDKVPSVIIADSKASTENATVKDLKCSKDKVSFLYTPAVLPFPADESYRELAGCSSLPDSVNREMLRISGLQDGKYSLKADGKEIATFSADQLAAGVNIAALDTPNQLKSRKMIPLMEAFHSGNTPLRKISACKMIARQEKADLNDIASIDKALDAWLERCKKPPAHAYKGRKQAVDIYRQQRDKQPQLEKHLEDLRAQMFELSEPREYQLAIERTGDDIPVVYVGPKGNDSNPGTQERPFSTFVAARDALRKFPGKERYIIALPGEYYLSETFELTEQDSQLTIEASQKDKVVLYGGKKVTEWKKDGENLWSADLPGVKDGKWDFHALYVDGLLAEKARFPATNTFENLGTWKGRHLPALLGHWESKPTDAEYLAMPYDSKDLPENLDVRNAEVRMFHVWSESLVGVASNDLQRHVLYFSSKPNAPAGAKGRRKYVVLNTREGMNHPGQWYLDRSAGKLVYWPLPGQDMTKLQVVAPTMQSILCIAAKGKKMPAEITLRNLTFHCATQPLRTVGFGGAGFDGAVKIVQADRCVLDNLEISHVGGLGLTAGRITNSRIEGCDIHHTGACGFKVYGSANLIADNYFHDLGRYYQSSCAFMMHGDKNHIYKNQIHDAPYSGIISGGYENLIEENLIYRVMRFMHDGAAIYGNMNKCTIRGNIVRDVVIVGKGYGASAYYLDEGARDCIIEQNVAEGVPNPVHNHITYNIVVRNNVFLADKDMKISFQRSSNCAFTGNRLFMSGKLNVVQPNGIKEWKDNIIFKEGMAKDGSSQRFVIGDEKPQSKVPGRRNYSADVVRVVKPPVLDGETSAEEWPGKLYGLDRQPSRLGACGPPAYGKFSYDDKNLYVGTIIALFYPAALGTGTEWKKDDGVEFCISGKSSDGKPVTYVLRGFVNGSLHSVTAGGASKQAADALAKDAKFAAKTMDRNGKAKGWKCEFAIPWSALNITPLKDMKLAFNLSSHNSEFNEWYCWEGTLAENWKLGQAGTLQLK